MIFFVIILKPCIYFAVIHEIKKKTAKCFLKFHESQNKQDFKTETSLKNYHFCADFNYNLVICLT